MILNVPQINITAISVDVRQAWVVWVCYINTGCIANNYKRILVLELLFLELY